MMHTSEYEKTFVERIHDQGIAIGEARGEAIGEARGEARGEAKAILRLLDARGLTLSPEQRHHVVSCTDPAQLDLWFDRAVGAQTAAEVFAD